MATNRKEHPEDICTCGDYRKNHPDNGPCKLNGLGHGIPEYKCEKFCLSMQAECQQVIENLTGGAGGEPPTVTAVFTNGKSAGKSTPPPHSQQRRKYETTLQRTFNL